MLIATANYQWDVAKLGDHVEFLSGFAFDAARFGDEGDIPIARIRDVLPGRSHTFYSGEYDPKYVIRRNDVLVGMDGEFNRAKWQDEPALLNQRVCKVAVTSSRLDAEYLYHFLPLALKVIENATSFVTVKHLSIKALREMQIPLPPLDEQKRIVAVLDKADTLGRERCEALKLADKLFRSVFFHMFVYNRSAADWPLRSVEWMAKEAKGSIRTGPFGSQLLHSEFVDQGIAVLGIDNAVKNRFEWGQPRFITPKKYEELTRYKVLPGDLIITIMGTVGRCAVIPPDIPEAINTKHLCCITLDQEKCLPEFLHAAFLNHPAVLRQLGVQAKGAVMPGLNMGIIKNLVLPMPPIELQEQFKQFATAVTASTIELEKSSKSIENLYSSLQQRAFRGELDSSRIVVALENAPIALEDAPVVRAASEHSAKATGPRAARSLQASAGIE
jgi:type I restriction enzyme, S subunit